MSVLDLAVANLGSPLVLFFVLGLAAALARSDLAFPEAVAKGIALYLMLAIGFKGGAEMARSGLTAQVGAALAAGVLLSAAIPVIGYGLLRTISRLSAVDAAAVAAHYGSISVVTFVAATQAAQGLGWRYEGWLVAVAAVMETPAIITALLLARWGGGKREEGEKLGTLLHEVGLNGSVVILVGSFFIGWATGQEGLAVIAPFITDPFRGVLCLFLLDMGLVAGRGLRESRQVLTPALVGFGIGMPLMSALIALPFALAIGLSPGGIMVFLTLAASASYIAVPAAMRLALPEARPAISLTLSIAVTFPFNLTLGLPLYAFMARAAT